ncbi:PilT/PilU family type 4a pilus ATPase [Helicobacter sp. 11S03491-1]|uniref:type IV pilus twitching motility protein PilT n=1 Tax=Helicobacter sp. 11S03491-1 TaxID=1476196 RepID=UPI000BA60705|nr:PilT/PilU family type 4a pilus ATPase [Helicobacter sp. 11S03491-1]PAF42935.1 hypothetical protein BKH45_02385 [Helicobacter sp. 11S03491-1]
MEIDFEGLEEIILEASKLKASDIHILGNGEVFLRAYKQIISSKIILEPAYIKELAQHFLLPHQFDEIIEGKEVDIGILIKNIRLRANFYLTCTCIAISMRVLPNNIPTLEELMLPEITKDIFSKKSGLILVSGPTGSGKSTTIASALEYINQNFRKHIICIEDPIEYLHENIQSFFSYREVGKDSESFAGAIKSALRQDPDIIFIGELRDKDSIKSALLASQMGHLVVGTTHSKDTSGAISRIINSFENNRLEIAAELALTLQAVIAQELINFSDNGVRGIYEVLVATPAIKTLIRDQKYHQIPSQIMMGSEFGMISFEQSRQALYRQ